MLNMTDLRELYFKILDCKPEHRLELKRMWQNCMRLEKAIEQETVECRRIGKDTARKQDLVEKLTESQNTLEQYLVFASLLNN